MTGPSVFSFTAPTSPSRHRTVAAIFEELATPSNKDHIDTSRVSDADLGPLLFDRIARFLVSLDVPRGLKALGYKSGDVDELVKGTLPQRRVLDLARESARPRVLSARGDSWTDDDCPLQLASRATRARRSCRASSSRRVRYYSFPWTSWLVIGPELTRWLPPCPQWTSKSPQGTLYPGRHSRRSDVSRARAHASRLLFFLAPLRPAPRLSRLGSGWNSMSRLGLSDVPRLVQWK